MACHPALGILQKVKEMEIVMHENSLSLRTLLSQLKMLPRSS